MRIFDWERGMQTVGPFVPAYIVLIVFGIALIIFVYLKGSSMRRDGNFVQDIVGLIVDAFRLIAWVLVGVIRIFGKILGFCFSLTRREPPDLDFSERKSRRNYEPEEDDEENEPLRGKRKTKSVDEYHV